MDKYERIKNIIYKTCEECGGELAVSFLDLQTDYLIAKDDHRSQPTASVYKIYTLAALFEMIEQGEARLEERYPLMDCNKSIGSGVLYEMTSGIALSLYDYAYLMMVISDNTAADTLFKFVGTKRVNSLLQKYELFDTRYEMTCYDMLCKYWGYEAKPGIHNAEYFGAEHPTLWNTDYFAGRSEENNLTSTADTTKFFSKLYKGEMVSQEASRQMIDIMKLLQTNSRIPKYLTSEPSNGVSVAHKTGTMDRVANDCGVVYTPKGDYVLSLLYNGNVGDRKAYDENIGGAVGDAMLANLSKEIFEIWMNV